jgi:exodeoxyribonuclease VII large subunit
MPMESSFPLEPVTPLAGVLTVSQLLRDVRDTLEHRYPLMWIRGELSNLSRAGSGHCYFTLKDANAQADCVMFRSRFAALDWQPRDGVQVEVRVLVTLYEPRGRFQLTVEAMRRAGVARCTSASCSSRTSWSARGSSTRRSSGRCPGIRVRSAC